MDKSPDAFRTISEVADWLGVQAHVLRFWESKFSQVKPVKRAGGRRYYRPSDMQLLGGIKKLLHDDGLTVKGVQKILGSEGVAHVSSFSKDINEDPEGAGSSEAAKPKIVPFKSALAPAPDTDADLSLNTETPASVVEADPISAQTPSSDLGLTKPEPDQADTVFADPSEPNPEQIIAPPPGTPAASPSSKPADAKPILPSFLHRPAPAPASTPASESRPTATTGDAQAEIQAEPVIELPDDPGSQPVSPPQPSPQSATEPAPEQAPTADPVSPATRVVDAPDPPDEAEIPYNKGPLAQLATLKRISEAQAAQITPLVAQLKTWQSRTDGARPR